MSINMLETWCYGHLTVYNSVGNVDKCVDDVEILMTFIWC